MKIKKTRLPNASLGPVVAVFTVSHRVQIDENGVGVLIDQRLSRVRAKGRSLVLYIRNLGDNTTKVFHAKITAILAARGSSRRRHVHFRDARQLKGPSKSWHRFIGGPSCELRYQP